ncbi:copper amine oxidase N-terminal domain-containing protein [Paenibacillus silvae]|uniref:copper amine oxidase N-terminal domain-containing protein n=1 Tax=Paenibacillus silvae TaxID=1325358 RepID=UPI0025A23D03|nr:copper amine oxidase N-terminal domain-containing protein [Paenibacillus silvae]MDM5280265.1 copper amine oxidase N-terminal domain-containing protein [Paenibacillus silvae]
MKKLLLALLTGVISVSLIGSVAESASAAGKPKQVEVLLNTIKMKFPDAKPFQDAQGSVMVPIRFVSEALGSKVTYSKEGKVSKVGVYNKDHKVDMTIGQTSALVDGQKKDYGTQIMLKQNRTFVPLRLVSEGLGEKVEWDKIGRWVWIGNKNFRSTDVRNLKSSL